MATILNKLFESGLFNRDLKIGSSMARTKNTALASSTVSQTAATNVNSGDLNNRNIQVADLSPRFRSSVI